MPRPICYTEDDIKEMIRIKETLGKPIKEQCREKTEKMEGGHKWPYVSINRAIRRYGLKIPKKYAEIKKANAAKKPEAVVA
jgi:aromatic ring hydroxylase